MTDSTNPPGQAPGRKPSSGPTGSPRAGRREAQRRRSEPQTSLQRWRTVLVALLVIAVVVAVSAFVFVSATAQAYACTTVDSVQSAEGRLGQIQADMGNQHINTGDEVTYPVCPPASGKHVNRSGFGPLRPNVYGPDDNSVPNGWIHNLEHGALVLLYSCDKGACDEAHLQQLQEFSNNFPNTPICDIPTGVVGPVVARFEQMPSRYAALIWNRALYMDELDEDAVYEFFTAYAERVADDGSWIAPPEPQCAAPSPSPDASPAASAAEASPSPAAS